MNIHKPAWQRTEIFCPALVLSKVLFRGALEDEQKKLNRLSYGFLNK